MRVILLQNSNIGGLEDYINESLEDLESQNKTIIDIKYQYSENGRYSIYNAMILYR